MSRSNSTDNLPPTARAIALLLASTPGVQDAQPGVLHQLLEFSYRYSTQVLSDSLVYAEHAGRAGKIEMDDVVLAVQARVGWEFGGRVPKEYTLSLASQTNSIPLPSVPEVFGVRLPPASECLTSVDFNLVPNKPPPGVKLFDEEIEEVEESDEDDDDMEPAPIPSSSSQQLPPSAAQSQSQLSSQSQSQSFAATQDVEMTGPPPEAGGAGDEPSEAEDEDGLFAGGDEEEEESVDEAMDVSTTAPDASAANGVKRKLVEEDDYD
ncbi:Transcription initiation factor TFIID subunit 9 [Steccherinum ochraceum]|uniref:Transcription initiation factor TFIID subunit 9 n=1 Tax=Steccherinum ochraceum TaxID=92696 RepID=A0A4R0RJ08_9APHY|nr:Transcription initiation factor TFIID subunit 9 [Steccherinum ochraceum]